MRFECQLCGTEDAHVPCPRGCGAVFYCSRDHAALFAAHGHDEAQCARMATHVAAAPTLRADVPFPWARHTVDAVEAGTATLCDALATLGVHNQGPFRRECACGAAGPFGELQPIGFTVTQEGGGGEDEAATVLPTDWAAFYAQRRWPLHSLHALWLDTALTLAHALVLTGVRAAGGGGVVHLVGPRRELDQLPAFLETIRLLDMRHLTLVLCGPDVPGAMHGRSYTSPCGRLDARLVHCEAYDTRVCESLPAPDLVFAPNAGVAAYPREWKQTLHALRATNAVRLCITDFTHEATHQAELLLRDAGLQVTRSSQANPWRKPAASLSGCALPACSNGWIACFAGPMNR
jgi:hypothetical protein